MNESKRRLAAVLAADVAGYSRLAGKDEERTLARLRALRGDLIDPAVAANRGRVVKRAGDGTIVEFRSVVDAVRCAFEVQHGMLERNHGVALERQIRLRIGIHIGDVVGEADGDLMGDGVNIAARLEGIAEPGGVVLSEDAWRQVRDRLDIAFIDLGERELKNIARPVRVYLLGPTEAPLPTSPRLRGEEAQHEALRGGGPAAEKNPPRLSIVVLPFANIGGDPEQDYFVDGVTESLTTDLSRISGSFVIARNTAFTYKGKPVDVKQIGHELNVRYVLEGSVQKGGNRLRVNVQLIEAESGAHLWAERFDKPVADLFDMQDEIVARLANQLNTELIVVEARRAARSPHPDSTELYFQGRVLLYGALSAENLNAARALFDRALVLDPRNADALWGVATAEMMIAATFMKDMPSHLGAAEAAALKALALVPNHILAHHILANIYLLTGRATQAIATAERTLALDRNMAAAHGTIGHAKYFAGRAEETEPHILEALRFSPKDGIAWHWMFVVGLAKAGLERDEDAVVWLRRSVETFRYYPHTHFHLAGALAHLGHVEEAHAAVQTGLALDPAFTIGRVRTLGTAASNNPVYLAQRERLFDGMRKAGVPEG